VNATVTIEAYDATGALIGTDTELLNAGQRKSQLLTQYIPALIGKDQSSGYVIINSDQPIASFTFLGTNNLSALSAIPSTRNATIARPSSIKNRLRPLWEEPPRYYPR
jgi:hypothetical protein